MIARKGSEPAPMNQTTMKIESDREIVIARIFNGPARIVFDAWTRPELVRRWWAPNPIASPWRAARRTSAPGAPTATCSGSRRAPRSDFRASTPRSRRLKELEAYKELAAKVGQVNVVLGMDAVPQLQLKT